MRAPSASRANHEPQTLVLTYSLLFAPYHLELRECIPIDWVLNEQPPTRIDASP